MILSDEFCSTKTIEEGRFIQIQKKFLLSSNFAEVITMFVAVLLKFPLPLIAIHRINLLTDSLPV